MKKMKFSAVMSVLLALIMTMSLFTINASAGVVYLNKTSINMVKGTGYNLVLKGTNREVTWSTSNKKVATVSETGRVTAVKKGTATIYATVAGVTLKCTVNVLNGHITTEKTRANLDTGNKGTLIFNVKGGEGEKLSCRCSDPSVVNMKVIKISDGKVYVSVAGISEGTARITLYFKNDPSVSRTVTLDVEGGTVGVEDEDIYELGYADQLLYYINIERMKNDLEPLMANDDMCLAAEMRAGEIVTHYSHKRPNGLSYKSALDEVEYYYFETGENIASEFVSAKAVVQQWMTQRKYRENILNPNFRRMGGARAYSSDSPDTYYWVVIFDGI